MTISVTCAPWSNKQITHPLRFSVLSLPPSLPASLPPSLDGPEADRHACGGAGRTLPDHEPRGRGARYGGREGVREGRKELCLTPPDFQSSDFFSPSLPTSTSLPPSMLPSCRASVHYVPQGHVQKRATPSPSRMRPRLRRRSLRRCLLRNRRSLPPTFPPSLPRSLPSCLLSGGCTEFVVGRGEASGREGA